MSYGLSKFIKNLLPKRLFYRGLLIVAIPIVVLQVTITLVFFDSLWIKTNKGMTKSLVSEIVTIIDIYNNESEYNKKIVTDLVKSLLLKKIIAYAGGEKGNVLMLIPPIIIKYDNLKKALKVIEKEISNLR